MRNTAYNITIPKNFTDAISGAVPNSNFTARSYFKITCNRMALKIESYLNTIRYADM